MWEKFIQRAGTYPSSKFIGQNPFIIITAGTAGAGGPLAFPFIPKNKAYRPLSQKL
jgi:hypothetical protein